MKRENGITLIALVITIIVLLILAGVVLSTILGQGNIMNNAENAVESYNNSVITEQKLLNDIEKYIGNYINGESIDHKQEPIIKKSEWNGNVQTPYIMSGMTPVYWSIDGGETACTVEEGASPIYARIDENGEASSTGEDNPNFEWDNWYEYVAGDNITDTKTSKWANVVTDDGSYWVWIPRFKYKISDIPVEAGANNAGKIEVQFIPTTDKIGTAEYITATNSEGEIITTDSNSYIIHPAFENGSSTGKNNGFANGEWDSELPGFWIAKYEMSMQDDNGNVLNTDVINGNVAISDTVKMVSKPNVSSWRNIQIGQIYQNCINYDTDKNSHMAKSSEWGAVTYLAHSQYGRNRNEVSTNNSENAITGSSAGRPGDSTTLGDSVYSYNTTLGMLASTTGNIYGVYDMSGGAWEYTSIWDTQSSSEYIVNSGKAIDGTVYFSTGGISDRTKTAYSNGTDSSIGSIIKTVCKIGDGIKEVYVSIKAGWFNDYSVSVYPIVPFSVRGCDYNQGELEGIFAAGDGRGEADSNDSFRVILTGDS